MVTIDQLNWISNGSRWVPLVAHRRPPSSFLDLRELSSPSLWLLACRRSHKQLSKALAGEHRKEARGTKMPLDALESMKSLLACFRFLNGSGCKIFIEILSPRN